MKHWINFDLIEDVWTYLVLVGHNVHIIFLFLPVFKYFQIFDQNQFHSDVMYVLAFFSLYFRFCAYVHTFVATCIHNCYSYICIRTVYCSSAVVDAFVGRDLAPLKYDLTHRFPLMFM